MDTLGIGAQEERRLMFVDSNKVYLRGPLVNVVHAFESVTYLSTMLNLQFEFNFESTQFCVQKNDQCSDLAVKLVDFILFANFTVKQFNVPRPQFTVDCKFRSGSTSAADRRNLFVALVHYNNYYTMYKHLSFQVDKFFNSPAAKAV